MRKTLAEKKRSRDRERSRPPKGLIRPSRWSERRSANSPSPNSQTISQNRDESVSKSTYVVTLNSAPFQNTRSQELIEKTEEEDAALEGQDITLHYSFIMEPNGPNVKYTFECKDADYRVESNLELPAGYTLGPDYARYQRDFGMSG